MSFVARLALPVMVVALLVGLPDQEVLPVVGGNAQYQRVVPARPHSRVELPPESAGRAVHVKSGENLQAALDAAAPGDHITLDPGGTYKGPFRLLRKTGDQWIVITTAAQLPPRGRRVGPSNAAQMPRLVSDGDFVIQTMPGAHHYRL